MSDDEVKVPKDFHESYYEHRCSITAAQDILKIDIPGSSWMDRLKRWWYDLFLLSYSDERSRIFYTSSYTMRMERLYQFRKYRNRIHPLSKFRNFREVFMFILFVVNMFIFHHNTSITFGQLVYFFYYLGPLLEVIIIADVFLNIQTGYINQVGKKIVLDTTDGLLHYGTTKLFLHVASAIPLQNIMFLRYGFDITCSLCKTNNFIATLRTLSIFGLFRVYECSSYLKRERKNYKLTHIFRLMRICILGLVTMMQYMDVTDMIALKSMEASGYIDDTSYVSLIIQNKFVWPNPSSNYVFFILSFGRICKSILLFSFSFARSRFPLDAMISLIAFVIANVFYTWLILECFNFITSMCYPGDIVIRLKKSVDSLVHCRQLPDKITNKINKYFDFKQSKLKGTEKNNGLYKYLPEILKRDVFLTSYMRYIKRIPYFYEWPENIIEEIVLMFKEEIYLCNDMVAEPWVECEGLFIVAMGELAVYNAELEIGHIIDGDYFGELSLVTDQELRTSSVVAITPCVMLLLEKTAFRSFMRQYPTLFFAMKQELLKKHKKHKSSSLLQD